MTAIPQMIRLEDVAEQLDVPVDLLKRLARKQGSGFPPIYRFTNKTLRVRLDEVREWLEDLKETPEILKFRSDFRARHALRRSDA